MEDVKELVRRLEEKRKEAARFRPSCRRSFLPRKAEVDMRNAKLLVIMIVMMMCASVVAVAEEPDPSFEASAPQVSIDPPIDLPTGTLPADMFGQWAASAIAACSIGPTTDCEGYCTQQYGPRCWQSCSPDNCGPDDDNDCHYAGGFVTYCEPASCCVNVCDNWGWEICFAWCQEESAPPV